MSLEEIKMKRLWGMGDMVTKDKDGNIIDEDGDLVDEELEARVKEEEERRRRIFDFDRN